jgi:hypothetical protein
MSAVNPRILVIDLLILYALGGAIYFSYHTLRIVTAAEGIKERALFFFTMLNNPLWRIWARKVIESQTPELRAYMLRIEIQKYCFFGLGILMAISVLILIRSNIL